MGNATRGAGDGNRGGIRFGIRWDDGRRPKRLLLPPRRGSARRFAAASGGRRARRAAARASARVPMAVRTLNALRDLGVRIALDDFGTGHSSLQSLRELPVDIIKVAKPFVDGAARTPHDRALMRMMVDLGALFGIDVVAEGIEREDQLAALRELGCGMGQGYLLGRPVELQNAPRAPRAAAFSA